MTALVEAEEEEVTEEGDEYADPDGVGAALNTDCSISILLAAVMAVAVAVVAVAVMMVVVIIIVIVFWMLLLAAARLLCRCYECTNQIKPNLIIIIVIISL